MSGPVPTRRVPKRKRKQAFADAKDADTDTNLVDVLEQPPPRKSRRKSRPADHKGSIKRTDISHIIDGSDAQARQGRRDTAGTTDEVEDQESTVPHQQVWEETNSIRAALTAVKDLLTQIEAKQSRVTDLLTQITIT